MTDNFPTFWNLYPRKVARKTAEKAWEKGKCDAIAQKIIAGLKRQLPHWSDPKFIPHPATWLTAGRWDDQPHVEVRPSAVTARHHQPAPWQQPDAWKAMMNVWMLQILRRKAGDRDAQWLQRLLAERDRLAAQCREMWGLLIPPERDLEVLGGMLARLESLA